VRLGIACAREWRRPCRGAALAALLLAPACGPARPELAPVWGKVTYKGEPVTKGTVSFKPVDPAGSPASGTIDADGSYSLQSNEPGDGALPGEYKVAVSTVTTDQILDYIPKKRVAKPKSPVPEKYANPETSGITRTVKPGRNDIPIELE
jgi:hypothetical protein